MGQSQLARLAFGAATWGALDLGVLTCTPPAAAARQAKGCDAKIASGGGRMGVTMDRCECAGLGWDLGVPASVVARLAGTQAFASAPWAGSCS